MSLNVTSLVARSADGALAFDLMNGSAGKEPAASIQGSYDDASAELSVTALTVSLGLGSYWRDLLDALKQSDASWYVGRLGSSAGCDVLASWLASDPSVQDNGAPLCDAACAAQACSSALQALVNAAHTDYAALDAQYSTIRIAGQVRAHERTGDALIDDFGPAQMTGHWGNTSGSVPGDEVKASFATMTGEPGLSL
jgi:hypothetical protein